MNIIADESVELEIINALRVLQHNVISIAEIHPGLPDQKVIHLAKQHSAVLLTPDKDFGALVFHKKEITTGIVLFRLFLASNEQKASLIKAAFQQYGARFPKSFTVINEKEIRIRPL